jgi:CMP-N-acetylneuraminic acid synthetase
MKRSDALPDLFIDNGSTYVVQTSHFLKTKTFQSTLQGAYFMPRNKSIDLDKMEDLELLQYYSNI